MENRKRPVTQKEYQRLNALPLSKVQKDRIIQIWSTIDEQREAIITKIINVIIEYGVLLLIIAQALSPDPNHMEIIKTSGWMIIVVMISKIISHILPTPIERLLSLEQLKIYCNWRSKKVWRIIEFLKNVMVTLGFTYLQMSTMAITYGVLTVVSVILVKIRKKMIEELLKQINQNHYGENTIPI